MNKGGTIAKHQTKKVKHKYYQVNHKIQSSKLRVLDEYGEHIGVMDKRDAIKKAREQDKDVVVIARNAKPPVAKIIDFAKFKYQKQQERSKQKKKTKKQDIKEVRCSPFMGEADIEQRTKRVREFLEDGDKVRINVRFKGRQITRKEFGYKVVNNIIDEMKDIATLEMPPRLVGRELRAQLQPQT